MPYITTPNERITEGETITLIISRPTSPSTVGLIGFSRSDISQNALRGYEIDLQGWGLGWYKPSLIGRIIDLDFSSWEYTETINIPTNIIANNDGERTYTFYYVKPYSQRRSGSDYYDTIDITIEDAIFEAPTDIKLNGGSRYFYLATAGSALNNGSYGQVWYDSYYSRSSAVSGQWILTTEDPDNGDDHTYSLVQDNEYPDNDLFFIDNTKDILRLNSRSINKAKDSYLVRVRSTDQGGLYTERDIEIKISGLPNRSPSNLEISSTSFDENISEGSVLANLSTTDIDSDETFTYSLVSGSGDSDNNKFTIDGNQLQIITSPDYETKNSYSIRVSTKDSGDLSLEKSITLNVNNINELIRSSSNRTLPNSIENLTLTGSGNINGTGNNSANTIRGNSGANRLNGGAGADKLFGNGGNDILNGGSGIDDMRGGAGNDRYIVDNYSDVIREGSNQGTDLVQASASYILRNNNVENLTLTGSGNINGTGNNSANTIRGNSGANRLNGGAGADKLFGNGGNDVLLGGSGNDRLVGGNGIDRLTGGVGNDTLTGGLGNDIFQINTGVGRDVITDYTSREDRIKLLGGLTSNDLTFSYDGRHTRISDDNDLLAIVQNTIADDITFI